jgi:hypothetical protein
VEKERPRQFSLNVTAMFGETKMALEMKPHLPFFNSKVNLRGINIREEYLTLTASRAIICA